MDRKYWFIPGYSEEDLRRMPALHGLEYPSKPDLGAQEFWDGWKKKIVNYLSYFGVLFKMVVLWARNSSFHIEFLWRLPPCAEEVSAKNDEMVQKNVWWVETLISGWMFSWGGSRLEKKWPSLSLSHSRSTWYKMLTVVRRQAKPNCCNL